MGIDIYWENERGERLAVLPDGGHLVIRFLPDPDAKEFPCLRFVDPSGDTFFNQAQIGEMVWELERLLALKNKYDSKVERHLRDTLEFARKALGHCHTHIKFCGD
jgi:hypothetical protein